MALIERRAPTAQELALHLAAEKEPSEHEAALARRRQAQNDHHHKQIWSKHPHGGAYYKVAPSPPAPALSTSKALALAQTPAQQQWPDWVTAGYEVVKIGKTTNIVGDAMSQAAVDLVHQQLQPGHSTLSGRQGVLATHWSRQQKTVSPPAADHPDPTEQCPIDVVSRCPLCYPGALCQGIASDAAGDPAGDTAGHTARDICPTRGGVETNASQPVCEVCQAKEQARARFNKLWARLEAQGKAPCV